MNKEELKEEMKNRISLALKDPILQQGFEIICKENAELKEQIIDLKDFVLKVSKFLHNNNNVRPDNLIYKERDVLLIKELKLFEKWESSK